MTDNINMRDLFHHLLKAVVVKMSPVAGVRLYRSSRFAHFFIEDINPSWTMDKAILSYSHKGKSFCYNEKDEEDRSLPMTQIRFIRFSRIMIDGIDDKYYNEVVKLDIKGMRRIETVLLRKYTPLHILQDIIRLTTPTTLAFNSDACGLEESLSRNIPHVIVVIWNMNEAVYAQDPTILCRLGSTSKTLSITCLENFPETLDTFMRSWLRGGNTGVLDTLTLTKNFPSDEIGSEWMDVWENQNIQRLAKSAQMKNPKEYFYERNGTGTIYVYVCQYFIRVNFFP